MVNKQTLQSLGAGKKGRMNAQEPRFDQRRWKKSREQYTGPGDLVTEARGLCFVQMPEECSELIDQIE